MHVTIWILQSIRSNTCCEWIAAADTVTSRSETRLVIVANTLHDRLMLKKIVSRKIYDQKGKVKAQIVILGNGLISCNVSVQLRVQI